VNFRKLSVLFVLISTCIKIANFGWKMCRELGCSKSFLSNFLGAGLLHGYRLRLTNVCSLSILAISKTFTGTYWYMVENLILENFFESSVYVKQQISAWLNRLMWETEIGSLRLNYFAAVASFHHCLGNFCSVSLVQRNKNLSSKANIWQSQSWNLLHLL